MKRSVRVIMCAAIAASCVAGQLAYAGAKPGVDGLFSTSLFEAKSAVGQDGLYRFLFDYNDAPSGSPSTYSGSVLWIIDPNGGVVATGNTMIPASVGATFLKSSILDRAAFFFERSNTAIFAQPDGNTTVLFYYGLSSDITTTAFATWTFNSSGALIASAAYGPYSGVRISGLYFEPNGKIVARWQVGTSFQGPQTLAAWALDEFGSVVSATSYFGPFTPGPGKIRVNSQGQQIWPFRFQQSGGTWLTTFWTFAPNGASIVNSQSYGPF